MREKFTKKLISLFTFLFLIVPFCVYSQTTGSIGGTVFDEMGVPLPGATVKIDGTNLGASTNDNGEYVILNVSVGEYNVTGSFIGYDDTRVTNVRVSVDQRTRVDINLTLGGGIITDVIEIEAERKGIDVEQSGRLIESQQIENTGIRGITNIVSQTAGVVADERGTTLNIRGGRSNENIIIVDGVQTTNPIDGSNRANVPNALLQEIAVLTGGFGAEYGNVLSGVINVTTRSGSDRYTGGFEVITDEFSDFASTRSYGYNLYSLSLGGPLIPSKDLARVFNIYLNVERQFQRVSNPSWISQNIDYLYPDARDPNNELGSFSYNGRFNINLIDMKDGPPIIIRTGLSLSETKSRFRVGGNLYQNSDRNPNVFDDDLQYFGRLVHNVSNTFFYELQFNYFETKSKRNDPIHGDDLVRYGDPAYNPGFTQLGVTYQTDPNTSFLYNRVGSVWPTYLKREVSYWGGKIDATWAILSRKFGDHEIKFGGEYKYHTLRSLTVNAGAIADTTISLEDRWYGTNVGRLNAYGYDDIFDQSGLPVITGNEVNPKNPITGGVYIRDKVSFSDFNFNGGVRLDFFDVNDLVLQDLFEIRNPTFLQSEMDFFVSPRLGFSFPVTDRTIFVAQYGKMIQLPPLQFLYSSDKYYRQFLQTALQDVGTNSSLKPSKLTQYEVGIKQQLGDFVNMGVTAFYKESTDLIGAGRFGEKVFYANTDFAISRGVDLYLSMRRMNRLSVDLAYTLSYASGTGSDATSKNSLANQSDEPLPTFVYALDYDQRHTGALNLDYRFGEFDVPKGFAGEVLKNLGVNFNFSFNSGRPYTRRNNSTTATGSGGDLVLSAKNEVYTNWNTRIDMKIDKGFNVWKTYFNVYAYVINLLNTEIINSVFPSTGRPDDNGFINTPTGASRFANDPIFRELWQDRISFISNWGPPRQIRFGIQMNF